MNYFKIDRCSISNGIGVRTVLWVAGCSHQCFNCQNPETWDPNNGKKFDEDAMQTLITYLSEDFIQGITFSGGDPLYRTNVSVVAEISQKLKTLFPSKTQWLYTGFTWEEIIRSDLKNALHNIDVLVDGTYMDNKHNTTLVFRGSTNQRLIDVKSSLTNNTIKLLTDVPYIYKNYYERRLCNCE